MPRLQAIKENLNGLEDALAFLMKHLERYYGKKVMVSIDEYDTPFIEAILIDFMMKSKELCHLYFTVH